MTHLPPIVITVLMLLGVAVGGRTGLVAVVTGVLFLVALPFVAMVEAIPSAATAPALILVGFLMVGVRSERQSVTAVGATVQTGGVDFNDVEQGLPVVLTMLVMPFTYSVTNGIGVGFVSYVLIKIARGKRELFTRRSTSSRPRFCSISCARRCSTPSSRRGTVSRMEVWDS